MPRDRRLNATEVEAILRRYGFTLISQKGSHRKWRNVQQKLQAATRAGADSGSGIS